MTRVLIAFRGFAWPYRTALALGAVLTLVSVAISLALPWPLRFVVDDVLVPGSGLGTDQARVRLSLAVAALVALTLLSSTVTYWSSRLLSSAGLHVGNDLRVAVMTRLQAQSLRFHSRYRVGDLSARVTSDVAYAQEMLVQVLSTLVPSLALVVGMFVVMMVLDPVFTGLALLATPLLAVATHRARTRLRLAAREVRRTDGWLASAATEDLGAVHLVQAFTLEPDRAQRFGDLADASLRAGLEAVRVQSRFAPLVETAGVVSTATVLWVGAVRVLDGRLSLGVLLVFLSYLGSLYKPVRSLSKLSTVVSKGLAAVERVQEVLDAPLDLTDASGARSITVRGRIELREVSFSYGREPVLRGLSFVVEPGEHVALVGPTGAGKSTVAALVPRLFDVDEGAVLVDGTDVRDHRLVSLRLQVATVLQDTTLLDGTLRENIVCGRAGATERAVQRAVRLALVDEFAARLPDGLDTHIGERGVNLSGGQRQRVAIARAVLRDAPVLILDEPTSALDAESEELLLQALDNLPSGRTRLVIAHRLSTVRSADRILVLEEGRLVEEGSHDRLIRSGGTYGRMVALQDGHQRLPDLAVVRGSRR